MIDRRDVTRTVVQSAVKTSGRIDGRTILLQMNDTKCGGNQLHSAKFDGFLLGFSAGFRCYRHTHTPIQPLSFNMPAKSSGVSLPASLLETSSRTS